MLLLKIVGTAATDGAKMSSLYSPILKLILHQTNCHDLCICKLFQLSCGVFGKLTSVVLQLPQLGPQPLTLEIRNNEPCTLSLPMHNIAKPYFS